MNSDPLSLLMRVGAPRRPITRATIRRTSAPSTTRRVQHQALPSIFVHQRQPLERTTVRRPVVDEVAGPDVVLEPGRLLDATIGARPRFGAQFPGFSQPHGPPQPQLDPEPPHPFEIDRPAAADQHGVDPTVAVTRMPPRQPLDLPGQGRLVSPALPGIAGSSGTAPSRGRFAAAKPRTARPGNRRRPAAGRGSPLFFCDVLEHLFVEEQLGHQPLEAIDLELQLAAPAIGIDLVRVVSLSPAIVGRLGDAIACDRCPRRSVLWPDRGRLRVAIAHLVGGPSPSHGSLQGSFYRETPISAGPIFGEQTTEAPKVTLGPARSPDPSRAHLAFLVFQSWSTSTTTNPTQSRWPPHNLPRPRGGRPCSGEVA